MSNGQDKIKEIAAQLQRLQVQETELLQRLERLSEADSHTSRSPVTTRGFAIGDLAQMKKPRPLQAKKGAITKIGIGADCITLLTKNGSKTVRASFNLIRVNQLKLMSQLKHG